MCRLAVVLMLLLAPPVEAHGQLAWILRRDLKDLEAWVREDTNDAQRKYYLGLAHWRQHHWRQADSLLRLAMAMEPRYPEVYLALASLPYARRTQLRDEELRDRVPEAWRPAVKEARELYQRAFRTDPMVNLEILGIDAPEEEPQALDFSLREYQLYLRYYAWAVDLARGRYPSARERLTKLALTEFDEAKRPDKVPDYILWYRGLAAAHSAQYPLAIRDFRTLLDRTVKQLQRDEVIPIPLNDNEYRFMLAALHHRAGNTDTAMALYQESLEHDLGLVMAHTYLASIHEQAGRDSAALVERQRAADVNSEDPAALFDLAVSLFNAGRMRECVQQLYHVTVLNDRFAPPHYLLGRAAESFGQSDLAHEEYTKFLALAPMRMTDLRADAQQRLEKLPK